MNINPEFRDESTEVVWFTPPGPADHIELEFTFDVDSLKKLFGDYSELKQMKHDGP